MELLTYSSIQTFKACRKKYFFRYHRNLISKETPVYFRVGAAIHEGLAAYYSGEDVNQKIRSYFQDNIPATSDGVELQKWDEALELSQKVFDHYCKMHPRENDVFLVIDNEKEFSLPIVNPESDRKSQTFSIAGRIDMVIDLDGNLWIVEFKTVANITSAYKRKLTLDNQTLLYIEGAERFSDRPCRGVLYIVISKQVPRPPELLKRGGLSQAKNQITTPELYLTAINNYGLDVADYADFLGYLETNRREFFYLEYLTFSEAEREEWRHELWDIARDIRECEIKERWYRNTSQCIPLGGGTCPYFDICTAPDQEAIIEMSYRIEPPHSELNSEKEG